MIKVMLKNKLNKNTFNKLKYHAKHFLFVPKNLALVIAAVIAVVWVVNALSAMQNNFELQKELTAKQQNLELIKLEVASLDYEKEYYKTVEYQELAVRDRLGLAKAGEKMLVLGEYSDWVNQKNQLIQDQATPILKPSNLRQWLNFLFGANTK